MINLKIIQFETVVVIGRRGALGWRDLQRWKRDGITS